MKPVPWAVLLIGLLVGPVADSQEVSDRHSQMIYDAQDALTIRENDLALRNAQKIIDGETADEYVKSYGYEVLGLVNLAEGRFAAALRNFEIVLGVESEPGDRRSTALYLAAVAADRKQDFETAGTYLSEYLDATDIPYAHAWYIQARQEFERGNFEETIEYLHDAFHFAKVQSYSEVETDWLILRFMAYVELRDADNIVTSYDALPTALRYENVMWVAANTLLELGHCEGAVPITDELIEHVPAPQNQEFAQGVYEACADGAKASRTRTPRE
ncbi:MAG: hypothetical protein QNJ00_04815 [Woeseiaceae bacterium]|nr:hypothetical protein [Woeseiaceae bacterium]